MKFTLACILTSICIHVCIARYANINKHSLRIVGGRNATEDEFPYVVKLMLQSLSTRVRANIFVCSAAVLSSKWTLTAGHCISGIGHLMMSTRIQTKAVIEYQPSPKSEVAYSEVTSTIMHPGINHQTVKNDIGLLHTQPVLSARYGKLSPIDYPTLIGQEVLIVGYGMVNNVAQDPPPILPQVLEVIVKQCSDSYFYPQMCFAPPCTAHVHDFRAMCQGDSGGPSIHDSGIVSINTMTDVRNCGIYTGARERRDRYDTGYEVGTATPVSPFLDWISSAMKMEVA